MTLGQSPSPEQSALQNRLIGFLAEQVPPSAIELTPETAIFRTGLFDSLALVQLVIWVEEAIGSPLDPSTVDLPRDWATIAHLASFIETAPASAPDADRWRARQEARLITGARYQVVAYDPKLKPALAELQTLLWSPSPERNAAIFEWKYERNPYAQRPHVYVVLCDGKVVGMRGIYGSRWEVGATGAAPSAMCAGDLVIAPEHRNRGLFTRIMEHALADLEREGVSYLFNFSAGDSTRLGSLASGWGSVGPMQRMRGLIPRWLPFAMPQSGPRAALSRTIRKPSQWVGRFLRRRWPTRGIVAVDASRPGAMADLVRRLGHDGRIRHLRDETFFEWRFRNPIGTYRFFFLGGDRLEGYLVRQAQTHPSGGRSYRLVDFEGESQEVRAALIAAALDSGEPGSVHVWAGTLPEETRAVLGAAGFVEHKARSMAEYYPTILVRPVASTIPDRPWLFGGRDVLDLKSWDVRLLDSDGS